MKHEFWEEERLEFSCTRCSACCGGAPGFVFLSLNDLASLLAHTGLEFPEFFRLYAKFVDNGTGLSVSLREKQNFECIFLGRNGCEVYEARPIQCSTYPFWQGIVDSLKDWQQESSDCPGIGIGDCVSPERIKKAILDRRLQGILSLPYGFDPSIDALPSVPEVSSLQSINSFSTEKKT